MQIGKEYKIESDVLCITLFKKIKREQKETGAKYDAWIPVGYFATPKGALHELVNQKIRDTGLKTIERVVKEIDKLHEMIESLSESVLQP